MTPAEHPANGQPDDRIGSSEAWFDLHRVTHDAATGSVQQRAFMPPDAVPPGGGGLTEATPVRQRDQLDPVAVERDESEEQLPNNRSAHPPRFGVEARTVRRVGHPDER